MMVLTPLFKMMNGSINGGIDNSSDSRVIDRHFNPINHAETVDMNDMAKYPDNIALLHNRFLVNKIARETQSRFIESWEGTFHGA